MDDTTLSVRERIEVALMHLSNENTMPSVALVCRLAGVSRANLYTSHPDIVKNIRSLATRKSNAHSTTTLKTVVSSTVRRDQKKLIDSLAYTCLELRLALDDELAKGARLSEEISTLKSELLRATKVRR